MRPSEHFHPQHRLGSTWNGRADGQSPDALPNGLKQLSTISMPPLGWKAHVTELCNIDWDLLKSKTIMPTRKCGKTHHSEVG